MAKPFDAATKDLIELAPAAWLEVLGIHRPPEAVSVIDADLSTVTAAADKVIRVADDPPWLLHVELQTGGDATLPARMLMYNAILHDRHRMPVSTVVFLLRPAANATAVTGRLRMAPPFGPAWEFAYTVVRVWELPVEQLLAGPLAVLPIAPVVVDRSAVAAVAARVQARLRAEADPDTAAKLRTATAVLLTMRYDQMTVDDLIERNPEVKAFFERFALREGAAEARKLILRMGRKRFGPPPTGAEEKVNAMTDLARLEALSERLLDVSSWAELLAE